MRPGRLPAETLYPLLTFLYNLFFNIVLAVNLVYQTQEAGLNPFQLVLVGTSVEATSFLFEVPTGVVADAKSRRLSVIIGFALLGAGFVLTGLFAAFVPILLAHVVIGLARTFISGAQEAWIADEVGVEEVGKVYLRGVQTEQYGRLMGIPIGTGLGVLRLSLPLIAGGVLTMLLAGFLALTMTEHGFQPAPASERTTWNLYGARLVAASQQVRTNPLLITILAITAFYGAAGEGFGRLYVAHFIDNIGFPSAPDLEPVVWFGALRLASSLLTLVALRQVRLSVDTTSHRSVSRALLIINSLQMASLLVFAVTGDFYLGAASYLGAAVLSRMFDPLYLAWINQNVDSQVRATVISINNQMDSFGQIGGGPVLGAAGSLGSTRLAMLGAALLMSPAIALYFRAFGQSPDQPQDVAAERV